MLFILFSSLVNRLLQLLNPAHHCSFLMKRLSEDIPDLECLPASVRIQHVMWFKRQVLMCLDEPDLDSFFRGRYEGKSYMVYTGTGSTRCVASVDFGY